MAAPIELRDAIIGMGRYWSSEMRSDAKRVERRAVSVTCPPNPDPGAMRVPMDPGEVQEALEDEADEAHTGTDRDQAA